MILQITITSKRHYDDEIASITIKNGNWKYHDWYMEDDEPISLTLNNIHRVNLLHTPVKDEYPIHDFDLYKETGEIVVKEKLVRDYDNLLSFINWRISNTKKDFKKYGWSERSFTCYSFDETFVRDEELKSERTFEYDDEWTVKIEVIE